MAGVPFDPESTMSGFQARRAGTVAASAIPAPPRRAGTARKGRPRVTPTKDDRPTPPFGNYRGNRVAYTINFEPELADRLERHVTNSEGRTSYGAIAVEAIRRHWADVRDQLEPGIDDDRFPFRRINEGRLAPKKAHTRKVLYITYQEAEAIESVRHQLGGLELGQLHRLALRIHLTA